MKECKCGVYKITNIITNKIYIGSSNDICRRWGEHKRMLKRNAHHSIHLQYSWNKHGVDNFIFEILEECGAGDRFIREQFYFDTLLKAQEYMNNESMYFIENSYNISPTVSTDGIPRFISFDQKIRARNASGRDRIYQVEYPSNKILGEFDLLADASKKVNKTVQTITASINKVKVLQGCNYYFCWERDYDCLVIDSKHPAAKKIYVYSRVDKTLYNIFDSTGDCAKHFNVYRHRISNLVFAKNQLQVSSRLDATRNYMFFHEYVDLLPLNCWENAIFKVDPISMMVVELPYSALHFDKALNLKTNTIRRYYLDTGKLLCGYLFYKTETYYKLISKDIV